jgi:predicted porin
MRRVAIASLAIASLRVASLGVASLGVANLAAVSFVGFARAADLPAQKLAPAPDCFESLATYLKASPSDCPLTAYGLTVYGTVDVGVGWESNGAPFDRHFGPGDAYLITKVNNGPRWLWSPNALSTSVIGIKMSEPLGAGIWLAGALETGFDPYSLQLSDSPRALADNNGLPPSLQTSNGDSSRAGQPDNSQGFIGLSHKTYGTLTFGRVNTLTQDTIALYDPMQAANAFSPLGWSGSYAGMGDTEIARSNTAFKYRLQVGPFRFGALMQVGGYDQGNGADAQSQAQLGADLGPLSLDAIAGWARDAVALTNYTNLPKGYGQDDLKATLSNNSGLMLVAKYTVGPLRLYGGYEYYRQSDSSGRYPYGFTSLGGFDVRPAAIVYTAYAIPKTMNVYWAGARYALTDQIDLAAAFYWQQQNAYSAKVCAGTGIHTSSSACAGAMEALSLLIDYKPLERVDLYAGVMASSVFGGLASGYQQAQTVAPTAGLRIKF